VLSVLARWTLPLLGRLLILLWGGFRLFDGEESLDAGVEVEGFAGPVGSDGVGVGMLEAVHRREVIVSSLLAAEGVVEVLGR
jgi:hypothetical protein